MKPVKRLLLETHLKTITHFNILNTVFSFKIQNVISALNTYGQKTAYKNPQSGCQYKGRLKIT